MSYFERNYSALTYPVPSGPVPGFRDAQRGAMFALGSHFSQRRDPAIVTMPTGSGKTAVLQAAAFLLRARRALVITPSRLVREQIYEDFRMLGVLKRLGAVPGNLAVPTVFNANGKIADWDALRLADAYEVVGQAIKSVRWCERERIKGRIEHRMVGAAEQFIRGSFGDVERMLGRPRPPRFIITIVQQGFAGGALSRELRQLFASAHLHLRSADVEGFRVMTSP